MRDVVPEDPHLRQIPHDLEGMAEADAPRVRLDRVAQVVLLHEAVEVGRGRSVEQLKGPVDGPAERRRRPHEDQDVDDHERECRRGEAREAPAGLGRELDEEECRADRQRDVCDAPLRQHQRGEHERGGQEERPREPKRRSVVKERGQKEEERDEHHRIFVSQERRLEVDLHA